MSKRPVLSGALLKCPSHSAIRCTSYPQIPSYTGLPRALPVAPSFPRYLAWSVSVLKHMYPRFRGVGPE